MNVNYCLRRASRFHGERPAIEHLDRILTYREIEERVERSARRLAGLGIARGDRVGVLMGNSPAYLDLYFSLPLQGALIVPLNTRWNVADLAFALNDAGAEYLILDEMFAHVAAGLRAAVPGLKAILFYGQGDCPAGLTDFRGLPEPSVTFAEPHEDELVGLFYTSGTTGGPKGAMLSHRNLFSNATHMLMPPAFLESGTRFLHSAPMFHLADAGVVLALTLVGGCHCFLPSFDPEACLQAIQRYRITNLVLVPTMINMLVNHPALGRYDLSSLQRVSYGASPMPIALLRTAMERLGCGFAQGYGMTELSPLATVLLPEEHCLEEGYRPIHSAGKPVLGVDVRIVDLNDNEVPTGETGEIVVRGPNVMKGYWKRPEATEEVLRGGWMHTGDMGRCDELGFVYVLDRKKDMLKPGGENVYSPEVEAVVCAHPAVLEAAVIGVPDPKWGEAVRAVAALRPGMQLTEAELIVWCRQRLSHYKCPVSAVFVEALPKGGTGKIQKNVIRERYGAAV